MIDVFNFLKLQFKQRGAILIEFAVAIPVLMTLVYFSYDVPLIYRLSNKMHKLTELFAINLSNSILKNKITEDDLKRSLQSVALTTCGVNRNKDYSFNLSMYLTCIKGTSEGTFSVIWRKHVTVPLHEGYENVSVISDAEYSIFKKNSTTFPDKMNNISIHTGEMLIIVEGVIWYDDSLGTGRKGFNKLFYALTLKPSYKDRLAIIVPNNIKVIEESFKN